MNEVRILVAEDEPSIADIVRIYLERSGYQVDIVTDGQAALDYLDSKLPDLVVLDIMLPNVDGFTITRYIREHNDVPIIMLTSRREEIDRIAGLELGADDYVVKPFSPQELVSRVRAVLRRSHRKQVEAKEHPLVFNDLVIDPKTRLVTIAGKEILLTAREFDLLWYMAEHPRHVFSRLQLLEAVWGLSDYIDASTVTVHIRRLREKIEEDPANPQHIQTVWGVGYKFEA
jgi:DNA-binding response OmpR family regulator